MTSIPDFSKLSRCYPTPDEAGGGRVWNTPEGIEVKPCYGADDRAGLEALLARHPDLDAVYFSNDDMALGGVMTLAMMLNLLMAALMGVIIPMTMVKLGRDPAVGSSVMITAITDTGGFFIFLGLATLFLM